MIKVVSETKKLANVQLEKAAKLILSTNLNVSLVIAVTLAIPNDARALQKITDNATKK